MAFVISRFSSRAHPSWTLAAHIVTRNNADVQLAVALAVRGCMPSVGEYKCREIRRRKCGKYGALLENDADIDGRDVDGMTPLIWAAHYGDQKKVRLLIKYDADVNAKGANGDTPLGMATSDKRMQSILMNAGAIN